MTQFVDAMQSELTPEQRAAADEHQRQVVLATSELACEMFTLERALDSLTYRLRKVRWLVEEKPEACTPAMLERLAAVQAVLRVVVGRMRSPHAMVEAANRQRSVEAAAFRS